VAVIVGNAGPVPVSVAVTSSTQSVVVDSGANQLFLIATDLHYHILQSFMTSQEAPVPPAITALHAHLISTGPVGTQYSGMQNASHLHTIPQSNTGLPSVTGSVAATIIGAVISDNILTGLTIVSALAAGTIEATGVSLGVANDTAAKTYAKSLRIYIDSTEITSQILAAKGWAAIGDGTGTHAFDVSGTGELDISSWMTFTPGIHILKIVEPIAGFGCSVKAHVEVS
jgi:hypothetical protein